MFQEFPYTNFHELNLDWIVKIAKDFLDQYTHIQEVIQTGLDDLAESRETGLAELDQKRLDSLAELNQKTLDGLADLQDKYDTLDGLLQAWYDTHSADIAGQLADAISDFNTAAETKSQALLDSWPDDYSELVTEYNDLKTALNYLENDIYDYDNNINFVIGTISDTTGKTQDSTKYARTSSFVYAKKGSLVYTDEPDTFKYNVAVYTQADANTLYSIHATTDTGKFFMPIDGYIRSSIAYRDLRELSDTSISAHLIMRIITQIKADDQFDQLSDEIDVIDEKIDNIEEVIYKYTTPEFRIGGLSGNGTVDDTITKRIRFTERIFVKKGSLVSVDSDDYKFNLATYSTTEASSLIQYYSFHTGNDPIIIPQDCYIMSSMGNVNEETLVDTSISSHYILQLISQDIEEYLIDYIYTHPHGYRDYLDGVCFVKINNEKAIFNANDSNFSALNDNSVYNDIITFIDNAVAANNAKDAAINAQYPYCKKSSIGQDASETFNIYAYHLKSPAASAIPLVENMLERKPKIIVFAGQHGDEKGSQIACAHLIDLLTNKYDDNEVLDWLHWNAEIIIVPCGNPWGASNNNYLNYNGVNLNRNWDYNFIVNETSGLDNTGPSAFSEPETQHMRDLILNNLDACHVFDFHTNNSTKGNPEIILTNWFSIPTEEDLLNRDIMETISFHGYKISRQYNKEYSFDLAPAKKFYYLTTGTSNNMLKGYAGGVCKIPSITVECAAREPDEETLYTPRMNKINTETLANWIYNLCLTYSKY